MFKMANCSQQHCTCHLKRDDYLSEKVDCCHMYSMILSSSDYDTNNFKGSFEEQLNNNKIKMIQIYNSV